MIQLRLIIGASAEKAMIINPAWRPRGRDTKERAR